METKSQNPVANPLQANVANSSQNPQGTGNITGFHIHLICECDQTNSSNWLDEVENVNCPCKFVALFFLSSQMEV